MLTELRVRDLAVIRDITLQLKPGLNVLTGETGAGKSLLVDALSLLLGERASGDLIRPGCERAVVEAAFDVDDVSQIAGLAAERGLDVEDGGLVVRRDINAEGRNRAWANGSPTTVSALASLGRRLVDLHGQHEAQSLLRGVSQRDILDALGETASELECMKMAYERASALRAEEAELIARREDIRKRADYLGHVAQEITQANLRPGEYEELEVESRRLTNVEDLTSYAGRLVALLDGDEMAVLGALGQVGKTLTQLERIDETVGKWRELLDTAGANVEELARVAREYAASVELDPQRLAQVEQRRDRLYRLKQKYGPAIDNVIRTGDQARRELEVLDTAELDLEQLGADRAQAEAELVAAAAALTTKRKKAAVQLEQAVECLLPGLGMPQGRFTVIVRPANTTNSTGGDVIEFLVTLNEGMDPRPLAHVASGGELSRLMLALKVVLARHDAVPTLLFDEVDQGIGGDVAVQVSQALSHVAESRQVLIITHLPQIAARATHHVRVDKSVRGGMPSTEIDVVDGENRVKEIARMLGDSADPVALRHAAEMLRKAGFAPSSVVSPKFGSKHVASGSRSSQPLPAPPPLPRPAAGRTNANRN